MEIIKPRTWKGVIKAIDGIRSRYGVHERVLDNGEVYRRHNLLLFRGQSKSSWELKTTLERKTTDEFHVLSYMIYVSKVVSEIESFTGVDWKVPEYPELEKEVKEKQDTFRVHLPAYDFLVYLRHHGFPSPLLDWTESPYIAAYFAYISATKTNAAIYCYIERPLSVKGGKGGDPMISLQGPYVKTDKRHFAQKSWYTVAAKWDSKNETHYFCPHESVFDRNDPRQDILIKIVLPIKYRKEALIQLNDYNINHFTLFQSEDSLIKALETKRFDIKNA
jgi:hypothetical protein